MEGQVYDDTARFLRAKELASQGAGTQVYEWSIAVPTNRFAEMQTIVLSQVNDPSLTRMWYRFPDRTPDKVPLPMPLQCNNCATWPRTLGLPIPENTGWLWRYIPKLEELGTVWTP